MVSAVASLNVAIPSIARDTHASQTQLSWMVDAYALVFAALLLPAGALGDRYGRRKALLAGLIVFGAGSAAAMVQADARWLIGMRAVLGLGAALVMPATLSTITSTFPDAQRTRAVGTWAGVAGGSAILGLLTSGLVLEQWSWRSVFAVNVVLAVIAIVGTLRFVPESADPDAPGVDWTGAALSVVGLGAFVYSIIEAPTAGWASAQTLVGLGASLVLLAGFIGWELQADEPLLDPRLFTHRAFAAGTLSITLQFFAFFGFIFLLLQYLQLVLARPPARRRPQPDPDGAGHDAECSRACAEARRPGGHGPRPAHSASSSPPLRFSGSRRWTGRARTGCCWSASCRSASAWGWR